MLSRRALNRATLEQQMLLRRRKLLAIEPFEPLPKMDRDALAAEGERLIRFLAVPEGAEGFEVRFAEKT